MVKNLPESRAIGSYDLKRGLRLISRRVKQNRIYLLIMASALAFGLTINIARPGVAYEVLLNGKHLGYTHDKVMVQEMMAQLDNDLRVSKGEDIRYRADLKFVEGRKNSDIKINTIEDLKVMASSNLVVEKPAYLLKTDDGIAFAVDSKETAESIMENVKKPYLEGKKNASAEIINGIHLTPTSKVPVEKILNSKQAISYINSPMARGVGQDSTEAELKAASKPIFDVKVSFEDTIEVPVYRSVVKEYSSEMYQGESYVKTEGSDGVKNQNLRITQINGQNVDSQVLSESIIKEAESKVIVVGTKPTVPPILQTAYRYIGVPYVWGGTSPAGFDCSGFTQYVFARHGIYLPRTTYSQINVGRRVSYSQLQPGDLVHFPGHVGIYIGAGQMIHAPRPGKSVEIASLAGRNFICGTRVL